jgi:hypothetical protein
MVVFCFSYHIILGKILGKYLIGLLGTPGGAFHFHFDTISVRIGEYVHDRTDETGSPYLT